MSLDFDISINSNLRRVALIGISSLIGGLLVGGVGGRVVMRISAIAAGPSVVGQLTENGNRIGDFTLTGTLVLIVFVGGLAGAMASVVFASSDPWLRWLGPAEGLGFGVVALALSGGGDPFDSSDFLVLSPTALNVSMFIGLHLIFGLAVYSIYLVLDRRAPPATDALQIGYALIASMAVMPLLLVIALFTVPSFCECEPDYLPLAAILSMVGATTIWYLTPASAPSSKWVRTLTAALGYGSLIVLVAIGLRRNITQVEQILANGP